MIKTVIIDDELFSREILISHMEQFCPEVEFLGQADSVKAGIELIQQTRPELVFLDIHMGDGTGFDLLEQIGNIKFQVIFVTSSEDHAIEAFKVSATDYLIKPVDPDELKKALAKIKNESSNENLENILDAIIQSRKKSEKIAVPSKKGLRIVKIKDIIRFEADSNYSRIFLKSGEEILVTRTLREYDDLLNVQGFARVHQSHLINLSYVENYERGEGGTIIMEDKSEVEVSRRRKDEFLSKLDNHLKG